MTRITSKNVIIKFRLSKSEAAVLTAATYEPKPSTAAAQIVRRFVASAKADEARQ